MRSDGDLTKQDSAMYARLCSALIDEGIWIAGRRIWCLSAAHTEADVDLTLNAPTARSQP